MQEAVDKFRFINNEYLCLHHKLRPHNILNGDWDS